MKKIITGIAALAMLTSVFAVDFSSRVRTKISVAGGNIDSGSAYILETPDWDQKDADLLEVHFAGDKAGADYKFFANAAGENAVNIRHLAIWLKPIEMLKFNIGNVSYGTFCEHTEWWKAVNGSALGSDWQWGPWSGFASVEGFGAMMTLNPINGLELNAGVTPGAGNKFMEFGKEFKTTAYGASVKADLNAFANIPVVAAVSFRDAGKDAEKILAIGASYGNEWGGMFYGFINARMRFEAKKLAAVALDNWFKLSVDKFGVQLAVPVVLRLTGLENDPSYMNARLKVSYAMGAATPYVYAETTALPFNDKLGDSFGITVKPGVEFSVGSCGVNAAVQFDVNKGWPMLYSKGVNWSIPVEFSVAF